jgi:hypothetical protein
MYAVRYRDRGGQLEPLSADELYHLLVAEFHAWILKRQTQLLSADTATSVVVSATVAMLRATATQATLISEAGLTQAAQKLETVCTEARARIQVAVADRALEAAKAFTLDSSGFDVHFELHFRDLHGPQPPSPSPNEGPLTMQAIQQRADSNLGTLPLLRSEATFVELKGWLSSTAALPLQGVLLHHRTKTVERVVFHHIAALAEETAEARLDEQDLEALQHIFDTYTTDMLVLFESPEGQLLRKSELQSRMSLLVCCFQLYCVAN